KRFAREGFTVALGRRNGDKLASIRIRAATKADLPILLKFEQGIVTAERPYDQTLKPDPISYYDIGAMIDATDAEVAVAERDGQLIGSGYAIKKASRAYLDPPFHAFIGFLYVEPEFRGQGVNQKVLDHLFDWARRNDLPEIHLTVYPDNAPAIRAYEKVGFDPYILEMRLNLDEQS
ncbi:MAG: GNAT family N-acetyltransferase, partial [Pseudomonadota bacterium]